MLADLPSADAARRFVHGESGAIFPVVGYTLVRAGLIGAGMYAAGQRANVVRGAIAGSLAIELFVLLWAANDKTA